MLTSFILQQDYVWFLGLLAWGVCLAVWWSQKRGEAAWAWTPWGRRGWPRPGFGGARKLFAAARTPAFYSPL
ncbi:MAG: hypothetical protein WDM96_15015 [Lacunisphaera sp.]